MYDNTPSGNIAILHTQRLHVLLFSRLIVLLILFIGTWLAIDVTFVGIVFIITVLSIALLAVIVARIIVTVTVGIISIATIRVIRIIFRRSLAVVASINVIVRARETVKVVTPINLACIVASRRKRLATQNAITQDSANNPHAPF